MNKMRDFAEKVDNEGMDYAILHYFGEDISDEVNDKELIKLWKEAYKILVKIEEKIETALDSEDEE